MEEKLMKMNGWFGEQIADCMKRREALQADDRADEADFEKIRANIYDVFRTVLAAAVKQSGGDADAVRRFFLQRAEQITASWNAAYEKARLHGDAVRMRIESIKRNAARKVQTKFAEVWEGRA